jgi:hypothetical protein
MPELVYDVKFNIDSSNVERIADPVSDSVQNSVKEYKDNVDKVTDSKKKTANESQKTSTQEDKLTKAYRDQLQHVKTLIADLREKDTALKKSYTAGVRDVAQMERQNNEILEGTVILEQNIQELKQLASTLQLNDKQLEQYYTTLAKANATQRTGVSTTKNFDEKLRVSAESTGDLTNQAGLMNKQFSGMNQTIFSFSDLIQDSTQFQYGFATGMRAIGNNIGFTAELFAMSKANLDRHNEAVANGTIKGGQQVTMFQVMKQTLTGTGGLILGLNVAVTAVTMLSKAFGSSSKSSEEAKAAIDSFASASSSLRGIGGEDFLGIQSLERQADVLEQSISMYDDITEAVENYTKAFEASLPSAAAARFGAESAKAEQDRKLAIMESKEALEILTSQYGVFVDENNKLLLSQEDLEKKLEDVREQIALNKIFFELDPLAQFRDSVSGTAAQLEVLSEAGVDVESNVRDQLASLKAQRDALLEAGESAEFFYVKLNILNSGIDAYEKLIGDSKDKTKDYSEELRKAGDELSVLYTQMLFGADVADPLSLILDFSATEQDLKDKIKSAVGTQLTQLNSLLDVERQKFSVNAQLLAQDIVGAFAPEGAEDQIQLLRNNIGNAMQGLLMLRDEFAQGDESAVFIDSLIQKLGIYGEQQEKLIKNQEILNNLQAAMSMAQAIGQLGEVFEASKQFQYAVALTSGALGIVLALSDSTQKSTLARFALAASVAAATAVQIKQIADTNIGSTGNVQEPSAGSSFSTGTGFTPVRAPMQQISFAPTNSTSGGDTVVNNQVLVDSRGLAIQTKIGERQINDSQRSVTPTP